MTAMTEEELGRPTEDAGARVNDDAAARTCPEHALGGGYLDDEALGQARRLAVGRVRLRPGGDVL